jgi:hypothetical protein
MILGLSNASKTPLGNIQVVFTYDGGMTFPEECAMTSPKAFYATKTLHSVQSLIPNPFPLCPTSSCYYIRPVPPSGTRDKMPSWIAKHKVKTLSWTNHHIHTDSIRFRPPTVSPSLSFFRFISRNLQPSCPTHVFMPPCVR